MDLNKLLFHHQIALIDSGRQGRGEAQRWAALCAAFYAGEIDRWRRAAARSGAMVRPLFGQGAPAHG